MDSNPDVYTLADVRSKDSPFVYIGPFISLLLTVWQNSFTLVIIQVKTLKSGFENIVLYGASTPTSSTCRR